MLNLMTHSCIAIAVAAVLVGCGEHVHAQAGPNVSVQLPTFHQFRVSTTVVVPDRGTLYLGGVNRSSLGGSRFGPGGGGRAAGRAIDTGGMSISATIIDHDEIDRALLAEAARRRGDTVDIRGRPVADTPRLATQPTYRRDLARARDGRNSLAPVRYRQTARRSLTSEEQRAATYLDRAQRAEANRQPQQAKIFYRRVVKHGNATQKSHAEAKLAQLEQRTKSS